MIGFYAKIYLIKFNLIDTLKEFKLMEVYYFIILQVLQSNYFFVVCENFLRHAIFNHNVNVKITKFIYFKEQRSKLLNQNAWRNNILVNLNINHF